MNFIQERGHRLEHVEITSPSQWGLSEQDFLDIANACPNLIKFIYDAFDTDDPDIIGHITEAVLEGFLESCPDVTTLMNSHTPQLGTLCEKSTKPLATAGRMSFTFPLT